MPVDSVSQESERSPVGMARLCSRVSGPQWEDSRAGDWDPLWGATGRRDSHVWLAVGWDGS